MLNIVYGVQPCHFLEVTVQRLLTCYANGESFTWTQTCLSHFMLRNFYGLHLLKLLYFKTQDHNVTRYDGRIK